jgi:hypothetical protein
LSRTLARVVLSRDGRRNRLPQASQRSSRNSEKIKHPLDKAAWLKVADDWIKLAEIAEARKNK